MKYVEHIKEIVAMQQNYARMGGVVENVDPREIVEDAIAMNLAGLERHGIDLKRHYLQTGMVRVDKNKVLQILVNLIQNAKQALDFQDGSEEDRTVRVEVEMAGPDRVSIAVKDNGIGISGENLTKVFSHGFTTRRQGHGFGLHSGALAAREMGGALRVESEGSGLGATFTLLLPASVPDAGGFANATDLDDQDPDMSIKREVVSTD